MLKSLSPKQRLILIIGSILFVSLLAFLLWYSARQSGKRKGAINLSSPLAPDTSAPAVSEAEVRQIAQNIYKEVSGGTIYHSVDLWKKFLVLSDSDIVRVYNEYDTEYQKESGETLTQWIDGEWSIPGSEWRHIKSTVLERLAKLRLT